MFYLISYDIKDDKRRTKIAKVLVDIGDRVQYSVFECIIDEKRLAESIYKIKNLILEKEDSVRVYSLCGDCVKKVRIYGTGRISEDEDLIII